MLHSEIAEQNVECEQPAAFRSKYLVAGKLEPRSYQLDIVRKILRKNYLVVLPTGLGKTPVAIMITAKILEDYPDDFKVIVLAPTKPLITQHARSFKEFLTIDIPEDLVVLTGNIPAEKRKKIFAEQRILFYTPETLRNDILTDGGIGEGGIRTKEPLYDLKKVALIIFDEAHHASGNYAYCPIARLYREMNPDGNILGLTASPGANGEKVETLCDNLFIPVQNIELKVRTDEDVKDYVNKMTILKVGVEMTPFMAEILGELKNLLNTKLLQFINSGALHLVETDSKGFDINNISYKQAVGWQKQLTDGIRTNRSKGYGEVDKRVYTAISLAAEIARVFYMVNTVERQGLNVLIQYLGELQKEAQKTNASKSVVNLFYSPLIKKVLYRLNESHNLDSQSLIHPKLFKLMLYLRDEFSKNPNLRALIFTELRDSVINITKHLSRYPEIKPIKFVGQASRSSEDKGLSQKKQIEILDQFRQGEYNVLVSTSVAEEGLDIAECDLVIFYDAVPSEIRLIQRRGRTARKHEGKVMLLYCIGTSDERYLNISMAKLKAMQKNLGKPESNKVQKVTIKDPKQSELLPEGKPEAKIEAKLESKIEPIPEPKKAPEIQPEIKSPSKPKSKPILHVPKDGEEEQELSEKKNGAADTKSSSHDLNSISQQSRESSINQEIPIQKNHPKLEEKSKKPTDMTQMNEEIKKSTDDFFKALKNAKISGLSLNDGDMKAKTDTKKKVRQSEAEAMELLTGEPAKKEKKPKVEKSDVPTNPPIKKSLPNNIPITNPLPKNPVEKLEKPACEQPSPSLRIYLRREIPVIYGLRKSLAIEGSAMDYRDTLDPKDIFGCFKPDLVIGDKFSMKVFKLHEFERVSNLFNGDPTTSHTIKRDYAQLKNAFETLLFFVDFLSYDPMVHGDRRSITQKIERLGAGLEAMIIPIDSGEELGMVVKTIVSKLIDQSNGKD